MGLAPLQSRSQRQGRETDSTGRVAFPIKIKICVGTHIHAHIFKVV